MQIGILPPGEPGVFRSLLLPEIADALAVGEPVMGLALTQDDMAIGAVAGYLENRRFQIASLYVVPDYRRCGGGRMLLKALFDTLDGHASGVEISFTVTQEDHKALPSFLEALGFEEEPNNGETLYVTTLGEASKIPFFASDSKKTGIPFSQLSEGALSLVRKAAAMANMPVPKDGLRAKNLERDLSVVIFNGSKPEAYVVFDTSWSGGLTLSAVWSATKDPRTLPSLLRSAITRAREKYPPETPIAVQAVNSASAALVRALLPDAESVSHTYYRSLDLWI